MTGEDDTGNPARLPLAERARRGLLASEPELWLWEIMELEFPAATSWQDRKRPDYVGWKKSVEAAIQYGLLGDGPHLERLHESETHHYPDTHWTAGFHSRPKTIHVVGCSDWRIPREPYRTWRATQPNPPAGSIIHLWLGTIPKPANQPQVEPAAPLPQSEPDKPGQGAAAKSAALKELLDEIDKRAAEKGAGFDRHSLPGTKEEFARLLKAHCPVFWDVVTETIKGYLKGECKFQSGVRPEHKKGAAVWALFSEYDLK